MPRTGDPVMHVTADHAAAPLPGPFQGQSMNCRSCHLVDELAASRGGGVRTYADFARRSPVPERGDGRRDGAAQLAAAGRRQRAARPVSSCTSTASSPAAPIWCKGTLTGRNFGWLPPRSPTAVAHIARVIREDDGRGALAADFGALPYAACFAGAAAEIPARLRLPQRSASTWPRPTTSRCSTRSRT